MRRTKCIILDSGIVKRLSVAVEVPTTFKEHILATQEPGHRVDLVGDIEGVVAPIVNIGLDGDTTFITIRLGLGLYILQRTVKQDMGIDEASGIELRGQGQILILRNHDGLTFLHDR